MRVLGVLLTLILLVAGVGWFYVEAPFGPAQETFVDIPSGTGTVGIAARLKAGGAIRSGLAFEVFRRFKGGTLRAGEYRFDHAASLREVYARLAHGDVYTRTLVIPEGYNIFDIAGAVQDAGLGSGADFLKAERGETALIGDMSPGAKSLEGFLFPDTYRFSRHSTAASMVAAMVKRFRQVALQMGLPVTVGAKRTVVMASLVEKEVKVDAERPLVAGVFENRLAEGMPLATDPTVIYAALLEGRWRGTIYASDLRSASAYNTYVHAGLPPGPIANPGVAALRAAMDPAKTKYLYFVADAAGHSVFSEGLKEHAEQVKAYRAATGR